MPRREYSNFPDISTKFQLLKAFFAFFIPFREKEQGVSRGTSIRIEACILVLSSLLFLAFLGNGSQGPLPLFSALRNGSITETSAYIESGPSQSQLADINSISGFGTGYGGQQLEISDYSAATVQESSFLALAPTNHDYLEELSQERSQVVEYVVREGDALSFIASDFGVSVSSILWANNISDADSISLGQVLRIPPVSGVIHKVAKGETVNSIADIYGADSEEIIAFNGLSVGGGVFEGDELIIPDGTVPAAEASETPVSTSPRTFAYLPNLGDYFGHPTNGVGYNWGRIHGRNGVDVADACGTPVYAAADGIVTTAKGGTVEPWNGGFGRFVTVQHPNGAETLYAHLQAVLVNLNETVSRGTQIGFIGNSGQVYGVTGCHLHFEVHGAQNPLAKY